MRVWEWKAQGTLAQVVEQWTENPCVLGSTPRGTTKEERRLSNGFRQLSFLCYTLCLLWESRPALCAQGDFLSVTPYEVGAELGLGDMPDDIDVFYGYQFLVVIDITSE